MLAGTGILWSSIRRTVIAPIAMGDIRPGSNSSVAHGVDLPLWQSVQGFGILYQLVISGLTNRNVWLRTLTSAMICSIFGMCHATHWSRSHSNQTPVLPKASNSSPNSQHWKLDWLLPILCKGGVKLQRP